MKRSNLETIVLLVGLAIIGAALFFMFMMGDKPDSIFYANITFSIGFLVYITYAWMSSNSLNKEIRNLNNIVQNLKQEVQSKDAEIAEKGGQINRLNTDLASLKQKLKDTEETNKALEAEVARLKETSANPNG